MSDKKSTAEPSMEEILASVRRILAEEGNGVRPGPRPSRAAADVLDLTEAIGEDGTVRHIEPAAMRREAVAPPVLPDGRVEPVPPRPDGAGNRLLSEPASSAVASSFARLSGVSHAEQGDAEPALDQVLRETLRPMLQAWLDENLPALVERLVQAEIARVVGDAGKR
jgi:cell pole-organizing protein PopZ